VGYGNNLNNLLPPSLLTISVKIRPVGYGNFREDKEDVGACRFYNTVKIRPVGYGNKFSFKGLADYEGLLVKIRPVGYGNDSGDLNDELIKHP
jgi:hypothetical protein